MPPHVPAVKKLPHSIELFLMLRVGIVARDRECALQTIRLIAQELDERESLAVMQSMQQTLDQQARAWLRGLY